MTRNDGYYYIVGYGGKVEVPTIDMIFSEKTIVGNLVGTYPELVELMALADRGIIEHFAASHDCAVDRARRDELVEWKARTYSEAIHHGLPPMPGAVEFVRKVALRFPLAIASGSLRSEVEHLLSCIGLRECFQLLVTAEDTERSKPEPEIYLKALAGLNRLEAFHEKSLRASHCLAIEDAPAGVRAAQAAGMKCLALAHRRPAAELAHVALAAGAGRLGRHLGGLDPRVETAPVPRLDRHLDAADLDEELVLGLRAAVGVGDRHRPRYARHRMRPARLDQLKAEGKAARNRRLRFAHALPPIAAVAVR